MVWWLIKCFSVERNHLLNVIICNWCFEINRSIIGMLRRVRRPGQAPLVTTNQKYMIWYISSCFLVVTILCLVLTSYQYILNLVTVRIKPRNSQKPSTAGYVPVIGPSIDLWINWLVGWLTDWLTDWLIDWLIDWLMDWRWLISVFL